MSTSWRRKRCSDKALVIAFGKDPFFALREARFFVMRFLVLGMVAIHVVVPFGTCTNVNGKPVQIVEDISLGQINQGKTTGCTKPHSHDVAHLTIPTVASWPFVGGACFNNHRAIAILCEGGGRL